MMSIYQRQPQQKPHPAKFSACNSPNSVIQHQKGRNIHLGGSVPKESKKLSHSLDVNR